MKVSGRRLWLFRLIACVIPFLFLLLLEIGLRLFNYGYDYSLFKTDHSNKDYYVMNPDASKKYFQNQTIATTGNQERFKKIKDTNAIRIFVLGESTTIGYPYFHNGSFHRLLLYRLMHEMPRKNFEIINVSLTAVNSYTILGFAKEVVNYHPDAVLIYTGQNEYYGALGVGSTQQLGGNRFLINTILFLRDFKITQLLTNGYTSIAGMFSKAKQLPAKDRMELMAADQNITYGSAKFNEGVEQFRQNMNITLSVFNKHHIPVFVSNLVSNQIDLKPFISQLPDNSHLGNFKSAFDSGLKNFGWNNYQLAINYFDKANHSFSNNADCNYYLGICFLKEGNKAYAKVYLNAAVDLDMLRFRAPHQMNDVIDSLCKQYKYAHFVNTKSFFEKYSNDNIIGNELLLEHVHPNLKGYAVLSDAFHAALKQQGIIKTDAQHAMSLDELVQAMPVTTVDSLIGAYKIFNLKRMWPFVTEKVSKKDTLNVITEEEQLAYNIAFNHASWVEATNNLYDYYIRQNNLQQAKKVMEALVLEYPTDALLYEKAANICGELKDFNNALLYFEKSFTLSPSFDKARDILVLYLQKDEPEKAMPYIDYAINNKSSGFDLKALKNATKEVIQLKETVQKDSVNTQLLNRIAYTYYAMGNKDGAGKYAKKALNLNASDTVASSLINKIKMRQ